MKEPSIQRLGCIRTTTLLHPYALLAATAIVAAIDGELPKVQGD